MARNPANTSNPPDPLGERFLDLAPVSLIEPAKDERKRLTEALQRELWGRRSPLQSYPVQFGSDSFLKNYFECILLDAEQLKITTHRDVIDIVSFVRRNSNISRSDLIRKIKDEAPHWLGHSWDSADKAVELAMRLWLTVKVEGWDCDQTLQQFINASFSPSGKLTKKERLPLAFNALNIQKIGGLEIVWTDCIQEHLSLDHSETQLSLFCQGQFLQNYQNTGERQIFSPNFLEETALTLSLLFPASNFQCRKWLGRSQRQSDIDVEAGFSRPAPRDLSYYKYWRERLVLLKDVYDNTEPRTFKQWWIDKRKPNQHYTFWIAFAALALTLLFGLTQSVTGILQVVIAYRQSNSN